MKAILVNDDHSRSLRWAAVPDPVPSSDEVLVEVHAAAINRADLMQRAGDYPPPPGCPEWMGLEIAGTVVSMGDEAKKKSCFSPGDKVCALLGGGGYAEYAVVRYDMLMPMPENCSFVEAAAIPEAFATAYLNLFIEGHLKAGDVFLMHAGASGLASVMIPMAKAFGAYVVTSVLNKEIAARIEHLGADYVINAENETYEDALHKLAKANNPVDIAIDCLGGDMMGRCLPHLSYGARWIMIATLAGDITDINLKTVYVKNIRIIGSTLRSKTPDTKAMILSRLVSDIWPKIESRELRPTIYKTFPIERAEEAQAVLERGENVGKVVLTVKP